MPVCRDGLGKVGGPQRLKRLSVHGCGVQGWGAGGRLLRSAAVEEDAAVTRVLGDRLSRRRRRRLGKHPADDSSDLEVFAAEAYEVGREPKDSDGPCRMLSDLDSGQSPVMSHRDGF